MSAFINAGSNIGGLNILYGVVGEGMGHATRSSVVAEHLVSSGHRVKMLASQRAYDFLDARFEDVEPIHGLHLAYRDNRVRKGRTVMSNLRALPRNVRVNTGRYYDLAGQGRPDVIISDFDSFTWGYGRRFGIPVISIDNMQIIDRCHHPDLPGQHRRELALTRALIRAKLPGCARYLVSSFWDAPLRKGRTTLVPPILRQPILEARALAQHPRAEGGDHILVYQTSKSAQALVPTLRAMPHLNFVVYGLGEDAHLGNVTLKAFSEEGFIIDLARSRAVIANGGYSLMSEAIYLGKPLLSVPVGGQLEQVMNAHYLAKMGYGEHWEALDGDLLRHFLANLPRYQTALRLHHQEGNAALFDAVDDALVKACPRAPRRLAA